MSTRLEEPPKGRLLRWLLTLVLSLPLASACVAGAPVSGEPTTVAGAAPALAGPAERQVALALPRFEFASWKDPEAVLAEMGVPLVFTLQKGSSG